MQFLFLYSKYSDWMDKILNASNKEKQVNVTPGSSAVFGSCSVCRVGNNSINQKPPAITAAGYLIIFPIMLHPIWRV